MMTVTKADLDKYEHFRTAVEGVEFDCYIEYTEEHGDDVNEPYYPACAECQYILINGVDITPVIDLHSSTLMQEIDTRYIEKIKRNRKIPVFLLDQAM